MQDDIQFDADTEKALALSMTSMRQDEKEFVSFKRTHDMTDLEEFQEREKRYCKDLELALAASKNEHEKAEAKKVVMRDSNLHFDNIFTPFINSYSLSFEAFCIIILRGYSKRCGSCAIYRDKRYQSTKSSDEIQDAMHDFCPHLICSEWSFVAKMRSIGIVFWERFLKTRAGRHFVLTFPQCKYCYWTDLYDCGEGKKVHHVPPRLNLRMPLESRRDGFTPQCVCISKLAQKELREWCEKIGLSESRVVIKHCFCQRQFQ